VTLKPGTIFCRFADVLDILLELVRRYDDFADRCASRGWGRLGVGYPNIARAKCARCRGAQKSSLIQIHLTLSWRPGHSRLDLASLTPLFFEALFHIRPVHPKVSVAVR